MSKRVCNWNINFRGAQLLKFSCWAALWKAAIALRSAAQRGTYRKRSQNGMLPNHVWYYVVASEIWSQHRPTHKNRAIYCIAAQLPTGIFFWPTIRQPTIWSQGPRLKRVRAEYYSWVTRRSFWILSSFWDGICSCSWALHDPQPLWSCRSGYDRSIYIYMCVYIYIQRIIHFIYVYTTSRFLKKCLLLTCFTMLHMASPFLRQLATTSRQRHLRHSAHGSATLQIRSFRNI